jgi:two-component system, NtrC family, response regulator HydG
VSGALEVVWRDERSGLPPIIGVSPALRLVVELAQKFAPASIPILIVAPTGCGKELIAQHIHHWSGRGGELVDVNCAALPEQLIESELFGHDGQAFTGARRPKAGLVEAAHRGTALLDEISSLPLSLQPKLLRVLETGSVRRVGETGKREVDVRFVAAAQDDLPLRVASGVFRRDLYQRLAGVVLSIPALIERSVDILPLARHFAALQGQTLLPEAERIVADHRWPGNVRELRQVIERSCRLAENGRLPACVVAQAIELGGMVAQEPIRTKALADDGRRVFLQRCQELRWDASRIMQVLGISRMTLYRRLHALGVSLREQKKYHVMSDCSDTIGYNLKGSA